MDGGGGSGGLWMGRKKRKALDEEWGRGLWMEEEERRALDAGGAWW